MKQAILIFLSLCLCSFAQAQELDYVPNHPQYFSDGDSWAYARMLWNYKELDLQTEGRLEFICELSTIEGDTIVNHFQYWKVHHITFRVTVNSDAYMAAHGSPQYYVNIWGDYPVWGYLREDENRRQWFRYASREEESLLWDFSQAFEVGNSFSYSEILWKTYTIEIKKIETICLEDGTEVLVANNDWMLGFGHKTLGVLLHYPSGYPDESYIYEPYYRIHNGVYVQRYEPVASYIENLVGMNAKDFIELWQKGTFTNIETMKDEKTSDALYDLQGRRVTTPTKGLYIINGKKVVIR